MAADRIDTVKDSLRREADRAYCRFLDKMSSRECLGEEAKLRDGRFGASELNAHRTAYELLGIHRGIHKAIAALIETQVAQENTRIRHEHQIKLNDYHLSAGNTFDAALNRVMCRWRGLEWFTDDQVAEIREQMIKDEWFRHQINRENRKRLSTRRDGPDMREVGI